jgi:hypothetical protein
MLEHMVVVQNIVYGVIEPAASPESSASEHKSPSLLSNLTPDGLGGRIGDSMRLPARDSRATRRCGIAATTPIHREVLLSCRP